MRFWLVLLGMIMALSLMIAGCGDDEDCTTCPGSSGPVRGYVYGSTYLDGGLEFEYFYIYGYGAVPPNIDSMRVGDSVLTVDDDIDYSYNDAYHDSYWYSTFYEDGNTSTYMYDHGDIATFTIYGEGGTSTCNLKILDSDSAAADIISPVSNADTIAVGESVTTTWHKADGADYYAILLEYFDWSNGTSNWTYYFDYTTDTTYTVTGNMMTDSLYYMWINVTPFTGPDPRTGESNWSGNWMGGRLFSFGDHAYIRAYGWNYPSVIRMNPKVADNEERKVWNPEEIIEQVYKTYE